MNSLTEENYIKAIYKLCEKSAEAITTNAIAGRINTKAASVTDMLKKLSKKKLINYQKYQGVTLTAKGQKLALSVVRKHRLWELFLVQKLSFKWDEVHDIAEQLEHIQSEELIKRIDKFLDHPKFDPHGDPIPDVNGKLHPQESKLMSQIKKGKNCVMIGVVDHSPAFLRYLDTTGLGLGHEVKIEDRVDYDKSAFIQLKNKHRVHISHDVAKNILVLEK
jgi:DtxR family Mn-dependent transcriptional regulator